MTKKCRKCGSPNLVPSLTKKGNHICLPCHKKQTNVYRKTHRHLINATVARLFKKRLNKWVESGVVPRKTTCEMCGKLIELCPNDRSRSISFDHKSPQEIEAPSGFLKQDPPTPKNIERWKKCDFGILCNYCNLFIPTIDRKVYIPRLVKYVYGKDAEIVIGGKTLVESELQANGVDNNGNPIKYDLG